ncbi:MAG: TetR/AcrR family transcriptional regulator [Planctomycetota bacterium]|jgi:TetR/AcrR family fatty acid metabolism transcriptional regulator
MVRRAGKLERRRRILQAARKVFARRGYAATPMSDVATAAGVGKGTLYEHFRGKEDLFATLVVAVARESLESLLAQRLSEDPTQALREVIAYIVDVALRENLDLYRLFFDFWGVAAPHRQQAQELLRDVEGRFAEFVQELVRRGQREGAFRPDVDSGLFVKLFVAAVDGMSLRMVILGEEVDLRAYTACMQDLLVGSLTTGGPLRGASVITEKDK